MTYLIVDNGVISNIIVADDEFASIIGAVPYYDGAVIGEMYLPPEPEPTETELLGRQLTDLQLDQIEQGQFATELQLQMMEANANV